MLKCYEFGIKVGKGDVDYAELCEATQSAAVATLAHWPSDGAPVPPIVILYPSLRLVLLWVGFGSGMPDTDLWVEIMGRLRDNYTEGLLDTSGWPGPHWSATNPTPTKASRPIARGPGRVGVEFLSIKPISESALRSYDRTGFFAEPPDLAAVGVQPERGGGAKGEQPGVGMVGGTALELFSDDPASQLSDQPPSSTICTSGHLGYVTGGRSNA